MTSLFSDPSAFLMRLIYVLPAVITALTFHEWGHAYMAYRLGDPTAKYMKRLTLNPLNHLDPIGTLCMIFAGFGWAKPVPIDPRYFRYPRRDDFLVSIAGVTMNFILFIISSFALLCLMRFTSIQGYPIKILSFFASINIVLMVFNLLPIPPLDGYHVFNDLILKRPLFADARAMQIGWVVLIVIIFLLSAPLETIFEFAITNAFAGMAWLFNGVVSLVL